VLVAYETPGVIGGIMAEPKFEEAMKRLEEIVQDLEGGNLSLEDSIKIFEEGMKLVRFCSQKLEETEQKVNLLIKEGEGSYTLRPFESEKKDEAE
jgi:exodeoxyribonuclease VII small subunit